MQPIDHFDTPLEHQWQKVAARELAEILHLVCCGEFENVQQLAYRLKLSASDMEQMYASPNVERPIEDDVFSRFHRMLRSPNSPQLPSLPGDPDWDVTA